MVLEVYNRFNELVFDGVATVNTTLAKIESLYTIPADKKSPKTVFITNYSGNDIYFSGRITATHSNAGGVIFRNNQREIPLSDLRVSPYFFTKFGDAEMRIEVWQ